MCPYRLLTLVQMAGALVYAAGVTDAVEEQVFTLAVIGYLIIRAGLVAQWLRVARIPSMRRRALRYAGGVTVIQLLWLGILVAPSSWRPMVFLVLAIAELCVPVWAERGVGHTARTYRLFHPEHIDERYGLFTIIVLGETILSATIGIGEVAAGGRLRRPHRRGRSPGCCWRSAPGGCTSITRATSPRRQRWRSAGATRTSSCSPPSPPSAQGCRSPPKRSTDAVSDRTGALAVAVPIAGYLVGLVLLMVVTHHAVTPMNIGSKLAGATAILALGVLAPITVAVVGAALVVVALVATMLLVEPAAPAAGRG